MYERMLNNISNYIYKHLYDEIEGKLKEEIKEEETETPPKEYSDEELQKVFRSIDKYYKEVEKRGEHHTLGRYLTFLGTRPKKSENTRKKIREYINSKVGVELFKGADDVVVQMDIDKSKNENLTEDSKSIID